MKILFLILFSFAAFTVNAREMKIVPPAVACMTEKDYEELLGLIIDKDNEAFIKEISSGEKCAPIPPKTKVFLLDGQDYKYNKIVQIRVKGSSVKLWTHMNSLAEMH